jgi:hypothetical protein
MVKIREILLAGGMLLAASLAVAGPVRHGPVAQGGADPECPGAAAWMVKVLGDAGLDLQFVQDSEEDNITGGPDSVIEEYLSFHAQVTEQNGKFSLMPWSGLRTHAN